RSGAWSGGGWEGAGPWARGRTHFWRPFGCLLLAMLLFGGGTLALGFWAIAALLGLVSTHPAVLALGLGVLVLIGTGTFFSTRGLRRMAEPLDDLVAAAGRVESGDYSVRVAERGAGDVRSLARAFNQMSARLEEGDARRRSFLADVAHELRTPLTVIQGGLEAVIDGVYPPDAEHLSPLVDQAKALEGLVDDLRTVALAEAGSLVLARESVDPGTLVEEAVAAFRGSAEAAGIALTVEVAPNLPRLEVDPARIRQVLSNLLGNALRHTPAGGSVIVSVHSDPESVTVEVRDTGSGIPPALLSSVFERFVKEPGSPGSGLGLAIAKDLVEAHGGTISAASAPDQGTTIRFSLPLRATGS
ncbi:MAG TPA: ATP-binding protein, partial [Dehalococcoidia bacterium]